ncbi:MAG: ABC transporter ATP-binding protein [Ruminococcaceae bacterium]|nr:ABC transporter ATP-binding protein [Oscillospiraceae bacterium]
MLHIQNLNKTYSTASGEIVALDNLSLVIPRGDFVAIVGRSGSGKTTLLNMIAGLDHPDSGTIRFDGTEITSLSPNQAALLRRKQIGVVYQFYNLIPELNVEENITLPTELNGEPVDRERLARILAAVGLTGRESAYPNTLSGGQQQRVAIARALFGRPSLLLADEPTGNLDGENSREILRLLTEANREQGVTVVVVTHSDEVAAAADRTVTLADGKLAGDRRH